MGEGDSVVKLLQSVGPDARFMDLGSYNGSDARLMSGAAPSGKGLAIEADPNNFQNLKALGLPMAIEFGAIADHDGECDFWVCEHPPDGRGSGSIREPTGHRVRNGVPYTFTKIQIPCFTLDSLFTKHGFDRIDMLWVDLQGGEKDMIAGGQNALGKARYMLIESEYAEEFYKDQAMRPELLALLPNWEIIENFDFNLLMVNKAYTG